METGEGRTPRTRSEDRGRTRVCAQWIGAGAGGKHRGAAATTVGASDVGHLAETAGGKHRGATATATDTFSLGDLTGASHGAVTNVLSLSLGIFLENLPPLPPNSLTEACKVDTFSLTSLSLSSVFSTDELRED